LLSWWYEFQTNLYQLKESLMTKGPIKFVILIFFTFLAACSTLEVGIEEYPGGEMQESSTEPSPVNPTSPVTVQPTAEPTSTEVLSEEQLISNAIADYLDQPVDQLEIHVTDIAGIYAYGFIDNGYFLAVKQNGAWQYVHGGQTNPYCRDVEPYDFPLKMVPECMDNNDQLVVRTDGYIPDVGEALAEYSGIPLDELDYTVVQEDGTHIMGTVLEGYFLAANINGGWQIVFEGQGNPDCSAVEQHDFPAYMVPECIDGSQVVSRDETPGNITGLQSLDCGPGDPGSVPGSVEYVACNIQDALRSRNISALLGYLEEPFLIGYWLSEGVFYSPEDFISYLPHLYNFNDPDYAPSLTFTMDRSQFPELDGRPVEDRFGPDVDVAAVIYSEGWGEGDSESLLYLIRNAAGEYKWYSMLIGDLDVPMPAPVP
jgi:hypothetical protein